MEAAEAEDVVAVVDDAVVVAVEIAAAVVLAVSMAFCEANCQRSILSCQLFHHRIFEKVVIQAESSLVYCFYHTKLSLAESISKAEI